MVNGGELSPSKLSTNLGTFQAGFSDTAVTSYIQLMEPAINARKLFGAVQKVFRLKADQRISQVRLGDMDNSYVKYPLYLEAKVPYNKLLGKNSENFFKNINYTKKLTDDLSLLSPI